MGCFHAIKFFSCLKAKKKIIAKNHFEKKRKSGITFRLHIPYKAMLKRLLLLILIILPLSCHQKSTQPQKTLKICFNRDPLTIDPLKCGDFASSTLIFLIYNGLTTLNPDGSISMALAKSVDISSDKKTYVFHLKDVTWSDGVKITAYDFEKSWKKIIDPKLPGLSAYLFYCIKNVEKIVKKEMSISEAGFFAKDENTFVVNLEYPTPYFLSLISFCAFFPKPSHTNIPVYSGPFTLQKWQKNTEILLSKNHMFWNKNEVKISHINIIIIHDENTALQMYEKGQIDLLSSFLSPFPLDSIKYLSKINFFPIAATSICVFNTKVFPFNNANMRKAFSYAINREDIVNNISQLKENIATSLIPPVINNSYNQQLYSPTLAKQYFTKALKELKISPQDLIITFLYSTNTLHKKQAETIQQNWQKFFNVKIILCQLDEKNMTEKFHQKNFQIGLRTIIAQYADPMSILERFKYQNQSKNFSSWENSKFIKLLDLSYTSYKRHKILNEAEKILLKEMPIAPIYHFNYAVITHPYVKNVCVGPIGDLHYDKIYLEQEL